MMREFRLALYFLVGVMLSAVSMFSYASISYGPNADSSPLPYCTAQVLAASYTTPRIGETVGNSLKCYGKLPYAPYSEGLVTWISINYRNCANTGWLSTPQTCTCTSPQVWDMATQACSAPPCPAAGSVIGAGGAFYGGTGAVPTTICVSSCGVTPGACAGNGTSYGCTGPYVATGQNCTGGTGGFGLAPDPIPPEDPRNKCIEQGQSFGTVNGVVVCTPPTTKTTPTTTTNTPSSGAPSTTNQTTNTTCTGAGSCTTTTTTTTTSGGSGPGGTGPGSTTTAPEIKKTEEPKAAFCEENPDSSMCADACQENPDLLQCISIGDPTPGDPVKSENKSVSSITPFASGAGACPASVALPKGAEFSYAPMCNFASGVRPIVLAIAWLIAGGMIFAWFRSS